jgi:hypothetical protein
MRWFPLLTLLVSIGPVPAAGADGAAAMTARATKLYRAKKYESACPLFEKVTTLAPQSGSAWADLGLCLGKLPNRGAAAVAANRKAIALSPGNARLRKAALYNLAKLENSAISSHIPGPTEDLLRDLEGRTPRCEIYDPAPGCAKGVWGCFSMDIRGHFERLALDPRKIATKKLPRDDLDLEDGSGPLFDGDMLVRGRSTLNPDYDGGDGCNRLEIGCRVIWADACAARAGIACESRPARTAVSDLYDQGDEEECADAEIEVSEVPLR